MHESAWSATHMFQVLSRHPSDKTQTFAFEKFGFKMHIPGGSLIEPEKCDIAVGTSLSGSFEFPQSTMPISAVYYIASSIKFSKPVTLELQHCCILRDGSNEADNLTFVSAETANRNPPYKFRMLEGGIFSSRNSYAQISVCGFSLFDIVWGWVTSAKQSPPLEYFARVYCQQVGTSAWNVILTVTQKLLQYCQVRLI